MAIGSHGWVNIRSTDEGTGPRAREGMINYARRPFTRSDHASGIGGTRRGTRRECGAKRGIVPPSGAVDPKHRPSDDRNRGVPRGRRGVQIVEHLLIFAKDHNRTIRIAVISEVSFCILNGGQDRAGQRNLRERPATRPCISKRVANGRCSRRSVDDRCGPGILRRIEGVVDITAVAHIGTHHGSRVWLRGVKRACRDRRVPHGVGRKPLAVEAGRACGRNRDRCIAHGGAPGTTAGQCIGLISGQCAGGR